MKKFLLVLFLLIIIPETMYAHPGRLDANGGHRKTADGTYHYHLGSDRTVEYETPPVSNEIMPSKSPEPAKATPKPAQPSEAPAKAVSKSTAPPSSKPSAAPKALPYYDLTSSETQTPVAPKPMPRVLFITIFTSIGVVVFTGISYIIYCIDRRCK